MTRLPANGIKIIYIVLYIWVYYTVSGLYVVISYIHKHRHGHRYSWHAYTVSVLMILLTLYSAAAGIFWQNYQKVNIAAADHLALCAARSSSAMILTHWGRVTHLCVGKPTIIGSDNGLSPDRRQAIIWTIAGILVIEPLGTNFSEILIRIQIFSFKKMHLKMSAIWRPFVSASMC